MKIKSITLKGWRSFSVEEGITLSNLKHINLIIGPNNSGKSNLFKYYYHLRKLIEEVFHNKVKDDILENNYYVYNNISKKILDKNTWAQKKGNIICDTYIENILDNWENSKPTFHKQREELHLVSLHNALKGKTCLCVKFNEKYYLLEPNMDKPKVFDPHTCCYLNAQEKIGYPFDTYEYWTTFAKSLIFIDPVRHFERNSSQNKECDFDGSDTIKKIIALRNNKDLEWMEYKEKIEEWLKNILSEPYFVLDPTNENIRFYINRGDKAISASLNELGTGVAQLFMLLSYLYVNCKKSLNVFIEEPECNLHPEAVVQFINIIKDNFPNHRFFISTHSSALIDQIDENFSVHQIIRKGNNASIIMPCDNIIKKYKLLDELGIRASQLLQSNFIIWVEGPSDRIYIKKWINDLADVDLKEGKQYSFLMYGGANLKSYSIIDDERFINVLSTSRYCAIVCDSDKTEDQDKLKKRVQSVQQNLTGDMKEYIYLWITYGREIENYIPHDILVKVLSMENVKKQFLCENGEREKLKIKVDYFKNNKFTQFKSFDEFYSNMYSMDNDTELNDSQKCKIAKHYNTKKVQIAKEVVSNWNRSCYKTYDLEDKITELIERIKKANGIKSER